MKTQNENAFEANSRTLFHDTPRSKILTVAT